MDVFSISANVGSKAPENGPIEAAGASPRKPAVDLATAAGAAFQASGPARRVENLAARLENEAAQGGDLRSELVGKFRALMAGGVLDTPEAAQAAANALVDAPNK